MTISSSSAVPMALSTSGKWKLVRNVTITPWTVETCRYIFHRTSSRFFADFYTLCTSGNMNEYSTEKVWSLQLHLTVHMVPTWVAPKRHLDRLTHFCTAYQCAQITIMSPVVAVNGFYWSQPLFDTWLLGPIWDPPYETSPPKQHLDRFTRFCTVNLYDQHTDHATCDICSNRPASLCTQCACDAT